ncbi:MAG: diadenylate cyclase CdaA [Roseburia sp.]|nr:diadenylate cyclase CdaA [Roseburia sp.]
MIDFGIKDAIDILCVAFLLYYVYKLMKDSGSLNVFYGILVFIVTWILVSQVLEMKLLGSIFDKLVSVGVLALIILFQEDIRRFFLTLGSQRKLSLLRRFFRKERNKEHEDQNPEILQIVMACDYMSKNLVGALIILERGMSLTDIIKSGEFIDANINTELIKNIFFKNSPLHDGAMIISRGRITAAGCILPVSHSLNIPKELGLRHRAALGITQQSDAIAIIVSEETGAISIAQRGEFKLRLAGNELESYLVAATK